jgi:anti-sigma factor RsiW
MDCAGVASHLVAYHFAAVTEEERDAIDAHLVSCTACLKTYLALKRATDANPVEKPSPQVKAKLRAEVARTFAPKKPAAPIPLFARRIPLYQGIAFAAIAAAIALVAPGIARSVSRPAIDDGAAEVDTSRSRAESLHIY